MTKYLLIILLCISFIISCDDSGSSVNPVTSPNIGEMSFDWLGDFTDHPSICDADTEYDAYYNTTEGKSYFCDGIDWRMLAQDGTDGTSGTDGTDGADGVDGKTIQVLDDNDTLLGYSIDLEVIMSPTGYLYYVTQSPYMFQPSTHMLYFIGTDCTGDALARTDSDHGFRNILAYNGISGTFYARRNSTVHTTTSNSFLWYDTCMNQVDNYTFYKYDPITREDSGVPETIVPPLHYEFK